MAKAMGVRSHIKRTGEKFAYAVRLDENKKRGVAYCLSSEPLARAYAARGGRWTAPGVTRAGAFGRGATCPAAKKAALTALRNGKFEKPQKAKRKTTKQRVAACVAACKRAG